MVLNKPATFYCWVQGQSFKKLTWRKLEGNVLREVSTSNGLLHINNVQRSRNGSYLCTVFTNYGVFRAVAILGIKGTARHNSYFILFFSVSFSVRMALLQFGYCVLVTCWCKYKQI